LNEIGLSRSYDMLLLLMQNNTLTLLTTWPKSKPEVEFQHDSRLFPKAEAFVSQLWIVIEKMQI